MAAIIDYVDWNDLFRRLGFFIGMRRRLNYFAQITALYEHKIWVLRDDSDQLSKWSLQGLTKDNTDDGLLWIKLYFSSPNYFVELYKDSGMASGNKVASGSWNATPFTITLSESNDSGIFGTVYMAYTGDDSNILLQTDPAWPPSADYLIQKWEGNPQDPNAADSNSDMISILQAALEASPATLASLNASIRSALDSEFWLKLSAIALESGELTVWTATETVGAAGEIAITTSGVLLDFINGMVEDSETVQQNTISFPAFTGVATPSGDFTQTSRVAYQYVRPEKIRLRCVKTLTETLEEFEVIGAVSGTAPNRLRIGATYKSLDLGVSILLDRKTTTTSTQLTSIEVTGESSANTSSEGKLYTKLTNPEGTTRLLEIFTNSARTDEYKVAEGQRDGDGTIVANGVGIGGLLRVSATVTYTGTENAEIDLLISELNDVWESTITNNEAGIFITMIGRMYPGAVLNPSGSPTIDEAWAKIPFDGLTPGITEGLD